MFSFVSAKEIVFVIPINKVIDLGLASFVKRVIKEAEKNQAKLIILEIDTFGGRVDAAVQIRDALLNTKIESIAFINKRAISAGALISLSCSHIIMTSGATIGAATPVQLNTSGGTKPTSEKEISYVRAEFRATAEKRGYPLNIAEAMVDPDIEIKGLIKKGKLLTLTTERAIEYKLAETKLENIKEILEKYKLNKAEIKNVSPKLAEEIVRFFTHPIVSSLLLSLGMLGLIIEFRVPGWGLPGTVGVLSFFIFFWGHYLAGLAGLEEIIIGSGGIILLGLEIFVIPGFGITGILGIFLILSSIFMTLISHKPNFNDLTQALSIIASSLITTFVIFAILLKYLPKFSLFKKLILINTEDKKNGFISSFEKYEQLLDKIGISLTPLRPIGKALIDDKQVEVITEGSYIEKNEKIIVIKVQKDKIFVKLSN
ncbi:MAG: NfeD family protein [bacterium]